MVVVRKYCESCDVDKEDRGKPEDVFFNQMSPVVIGAPGELILSAKKSASDGARNTVIERSGIETDLLTARFCHYITTYSELQPTCSRNCQQNYA